MGKGFLALEESKVCATEPCQVWGCINRLDLKEASLRAELMHSRVHEVLEMCHEVAFIEGRQLFMEAVSFQAKEN